MYKVYLDTNGKEAIDITGAKPEADVIAGCGLEETGCQIISYDETTHAHEAPGGTLQSYDVAARAAADQAARDAANTAARTQAKTDLGIDDAQLDNLLSITH